MSKSTTIVTTTTSLSKIADDIRHDAEEFGQAPTKQRLLDTFARGIAGDKHNWGFLTGSTAPVIQKGIPAARLADLGAVGASKPSAKATPHLKADPSQPGITVKATPAALYEPEMASYLKAQMKNGLIAAVEIFTTDVSDDHEGAVQCKLKPSVVIANDEQGFDYDLLWGASPDLIETASRAYFAASSSQRVNDLISNAIESWHEDVDQSDFEAFHMAHAVIIIPDNPFEALESILGSSGIDEDSSEDLDEAMDGAFQVFIDQNIDAKAQREVIEQVEDLLLRLARYLKCKNPTFANISVKGQENASQERAPFKRGSAHPVPISPAYIDRDSIVWRRLQEALGNGMATAIVKTPERRGGWPQITQFRGQKSAPPCNIGDAREAFESLLGDWSIELDEILNRRWNLYDNPYAKAIILPGMILLHEDPLGWVIDRNFEQIGDGDPLDAYNEANWAILMPKPDGTLEEIAARDIELPHQEILNRALNRAAREEGHGELGKLAWSVTRPSPETLDIVTR